jgi:hypothetical protein
MKDPKDAIPIFKKLEQATSWFEHYTKRHKVTGADKRKLTEEMTKLRKEMAEINRPEVEVIDRLIIYVAKLVQAIEKDIITIRELETTNTQLVAEKARLLKKTEKVFVEIKGTDQFTFKSGDAAINDKFGDALSSKDGQFEKLALRVLDRKKSNPGINDVLEIVGHTDGVPVKNKDKGNLDDKLPDFLAGNKKGKNAKLNPGSNNDLGLLRALAIKKSWNQFVKGYPDQEQQKILKSLRVHCYSAGQTQPVSNELGDPKTYRKNNAAFRRIEMRLR